MKALWSKLSSRERRIFCATLVVVGCCAIWQGAVRPYEATVESLDLRVQAEEIRLRKLEREVDSKEARPRPAKESSAAGSPEREMSRLLKAVESMARSSAVRIGELKPLPLENKSGEQEYRVELQSQASMEQLASFLYRIQGSPLALDVPRFDLAAPEAAGESRLKLSLTLARSLPAASSRGPRKPEAEGTP